MDASVDAIQLWCAGFTGASGMLAGAARVLASQACFLRASLWGACRNRHWGLWGADRDWSRAAKKRLLLDLFQTIRAQSSIPSIRCVMCQGQELSYWQGKLSKVLCLNAPAEAF